MTELVPCLREFLGNEQAKQTLIAMANDGRLSHALLITGEPGTGKRTFARLCAAAVLCQGTGKKPCGACPQCRKALAGVHPDVIFTDCASVSGQFPVERLRELLSGVYVAPNEAGRKVYILANCHNLSSSGPHALLKTLEEPPETAAFILTCPSRGLLLPTVLSRVVELPLHPLEETQILSCLQERYPQRPQEDLKRAAALSFGCLGEALRVLGGGSEDEGQAQSLYSWAQRSALALKENNEYDLLQAVSAFDRDKEQFFRLMQLLQRSAREALDARLRARLPKGEIAGLLASLSSAQLVAVCRCFSRGQEAHRQNAGRTLLPAYLCQLLMEARNGEGRRLEETPGF